MAIRICVTDVSINNNTGDPDFGAFTALAVYFDNSTSRYNSVGVHVPDPGGPAVAVRWALLNAIVAAVNTDNLGSTDTATLADVVTGGKV